MGLVARFFGSRPNNQQEEKVSQLQAATREQTRRQLVTMALRDTLRRSGLAADCISAEGLSGSANGRQRGLHVQLVLREWHPSLLSYVVALEHAFRATLRRLDPLSPSWMLGVTWRFEPKNPLTWPQLPAARHRKLAEAANSVSVSNGRKPPLEDLLQSGDASFRNRAAMHAEFSPTLPMPAR